MENTKRRALNEEVTGVRVPSMASPAGATRAGSGRGRGRGHVRGRNRAEVSRRDHMSIQAYFPPASLKFYCPPGQDSENMCGDNRLQSQEVDANTTAAATSSLPPGQREFQGTAEEEDKEKGIRKGTGSVGSIGKKTVPLVESGATSNQRQDDGNIPFEFVDDDEMACIDIALLRAHSVSIAYHSTRGLSRSQNNAGASDDPKHSGNSISGCTIDSFPTQNCQSSFVYTVTSEPGHNFESPDKSHVAAISSHWDSKERQGAASPAHSGSVSSPVRMISESQSSSLRMEEVSSKAHSRNNFTQLPSPECEESCSSAICPKSPVREVLQVSSRTLSTSARILARVEGDDQPPRHPDEVPDIEDLRRDRAMQSCSDRTSSHGQTSKSVPTIVTLLERKSGRGLSVTDFTASEWCEKQLEFSLNIGKPKQTAAMKAGSIRHVELEKEVVTRVEIEVISKEDTWGARLLNFISGARQLISEGLTRELPVLGIIGEIWIVGIIDEICLVGTAYGDQPLLVDTKTRRRRNPPSDPQKRNSRLQLMCYKMLWDSMIDIGLPQEAFYKHFRLNPRQPFCQEVKSHASSFWVDSEICCLQDLMPALLSEIQSGIYLKSVDTLILRYESQGDHLLLGEDEFCFERDWLLALWRWHSQFWSGNRPATFVHEDEAWKCNHCSFARVCSAAQLPPTEIDVK